MGFDDGGIILDREDETYYTGQPVRGRLEFDLSNVKTFRGIYIELLGFCKVHWTSRHSRRENDKTVHYTVTHESYEEYVNVTTYLVGSKTGEHQLFPGRHVFPFEFHIPAHCPSSYEASDGHVRYQVRATVDRAFKLDQHKTAVFKVLASVDLNANPYSREPIGMEFYQSYCCWCMSAGKSEVTVKVPASGACPRQVLPVEVSCKNDSSVEIKAICLQIREKKKFHAHSEPDTRTYDDTILEVKKGPIPGNTERNWVVELEIPDMAVPNLTACRFIDVDYKFKVKVKTPSCHENGSDERPFIIGTIPLSSGNNQIAPTDNVLVSLAPYPITNQPAAVHPYPNNPPNLGMNPPYPNATPPYPNATPPYPNANPPFNSNPPYPNTSPYPPNAAPYPTTNVGSNHSQPSNAPYPTDSQPTSPYPPTSSPYPPTQSPYPPTQSPYPPTQSPYPPTQSPYPPTQSPYPPAPSPYPPSTTPYDASPKPGFTGTTLLKTGNIGFTTQVNKEGATMPLLPPSAAAPYPTSPYATASAPEPSTPDAEGKKFAQNQPTYNSPFNPEYKAE